MKYLIYLAFLNFSLSSCSIEPEAISYGKDACSFCKMNIVDHLHAAEIVTKKGKVYKYDSIECLLKDSENNHPENVALYLVMDYYNPNTFLDAPKSTFLISENIPSPMGANLSAFASREKAQKTQKEKTGLVFNWEEIKKQIN